MTETESESEMDLEQLTGGRRFTFVQSIMGHPKSQPSLLELDHLHPQTPRHRIESRLDSMVMDGVVQVVTAESHSDSDLPDEFYTLTSEARQALADSSLSDIETTLEDIQSRVEHDDEYERAFNAPRPKCDGDG